MVSRAQVCICWNCSAWQVCQTRNLVGGSLQKSFSGEASLTHQGALAVKNIAVGRNAQFSRDGICSYDERSANDRIRPLATVSECPLWVNRCLEQPSKSVRYPFECGNCNHVAASLVRDVRVWD